jgi:hypothetical protein
LNIIRFLSVLMGELAVVSSSMLTPVLEAHARDRVGWPTYKPRREYRHDEGTAVIRPGEYLTDEGLEALHGGRVTGGRSLDRDDRR